MALSDVDAATIEDARTAIETFLSNGLPIRRIEAVPADEVAARTAIGSDPHLDTYQVFFRVEVAPLDKIDVLETRGDVGEYLRDRFLAMERNSDAPDTQMVAEDLPPEHLTTKNLVYYVRTTL